MNRFRMAILVMGIGACLGSSPLVAAEKWPGIDEAVVNRIAREHGRPEKTSLLPGAEGDLQLFLFLLAGAAGGFVAGYYWRVLLEGRKKSPGDDVNG